MLLCHKLYLSFSNAFGYSELCMCILEVKSHVGTVLEWLKTDRICFTVCRRQYLAVVIVHQGGLAECYFNRALRQMTKAGVRVGKGVQRSDQKALGR